MPLGIAKAGQRHLKGRRFRPPYMPDPYIINAPAGRVRFPHSVDDAAVSYLGSDGSRYFNHDQDVHISMPSAEVSMTQNGHVLGGRHIRMIGGRLTQNSSQNNIMSFANQSGSVFIEGMHADVAGGNCDGIVIRWSQTIANENQGGLTVHPGITVQHCLIEGIDGDPPGVHGDAIQNQAEAGGIAFIRVEELTFESTYQGIFAIGPGPCGELILSKVNSKDYTPGDNELISYYFYDGDASNRTTALYPVQLDLVYAGDPATTAWANRATVPNTIHTWGPTLSNDAAGDFFDFSGLGLQMTGIVRRGQPPGGDFVTAATCGLNYVSPWPAP